MQTRWAIAREHHSENSLRRVHQEVLQIKQSRQLATLQQPEENDEQQEAPQEHLTTQGSATQTESSSLSRGERLHLKMQQMEQERKEKMDREWKRYNCASKNNENKCIVEVVLLAETATATATTTTKARV